VLEGRLDSVVASRLAYILSGITKLLEVEQAARLEAEPVDIPGSYDFETLTLGEQQALQVLLSKSVMTMPECKGATTDDMADGAPAGCEP
jgi:hypothetical protein